MFIVTEVQITIMDCEKVGKLIKKYRLKKGLTQKILAEKLYVSTQAISKWERGKGLPDIGFLTKLSEVLGVNIDVILAGEVARNKQTNGSLRKAKFYYCPYCGNISISTGNAEISCCGEKSLALTPSKPDTEHDVNIELVEDEWFITTEHPMEKDHFISFVAFVSEGAVSFYKQYPEWTLQQRIPKRGHGQLYWFCNQHGLFVKII